MRDAKPTIPAAYVRPDTQTNAADSFANVHDLQTLRGNHNVIVARRLRRVLFTHTFGLGTARYKEYASGFMSNGRAYALFRVPFELSGPLTKELRVNAYGMYVENDIPIYAVAHMPQEEPVADPNRVLDFGVAAGLASVDVPLSRALRRRGAGVLSLILEGFVDGTDKPAAGILDVGADWVDVNAAASPAVGDVVFCDGATEDMRTVVKVIDYGSTYRVYLDEPWNVMPTTSDQVGTVALSNYRLYSITAYEREVVSFESSADWDFDL